MLAEGSEGGQTWGQAQPEPTMFLTTFPVGAPCLLLQVHLNVELSLNSRRLLIENLPVHYPPTSFSEITDVSFSCSPIMLPNYTSI